MSKIIAVKLQLNLQSSHGLVSITQSNCQHSVVYKKWTDLFFSAKLSRLFLLELPYRI